MNHKTLLEDYLRQNCRKVNTDISRVLPASMIICVALLIAKVSNLISYSTGRLLEVCLCISVVSMAPLIVCRYSYDEHVNRFACLTCVEIIFCIVARNGIVNLDIAYMLMPFVSLLYLEKKTYLRALGSTFLALLLIKLTDFLWVYRTKRFDTETYRASYMSVISLMIQFVLVTVVVHLIFELIISMLKTQMLIAYEAEKPIEMIVPEADPVVCEEYNTKGLFLEVNQTIQNVIRKKGKTFILDVDSELPIQLSGDKNKIRVMMVSLISDLVQFTIPGERIELQVTYDKGIVPKKGQSISLYCRIICSEDLSRYVNDSIAMNIALAKSILARMNGVFLDKTGENETTNTCYTVCFQQTVVDEETLAEAKRKHQVEQKELVAESRKRAGDVLLKKQIKALVVDDNPMTLKLLDSILKAYGMQPTTVTTSDEALNLLRLKGFDVAIIDHMMPVKGGLQTAKEIRQSNDEYYKDLTLIAMSSNITNESRQMLYKAGFNHVISKPIKEQEIRQVMIDSMLIS